MIPTRADRVRTGHRSAPRCAASRFGPPRQDRSRSSPLRVRPRTIVQDAPRPFPGYRDARDGAAPTRRVRRSAFDRTRTKAGTDPVSRSPSSHPGVPDPMAPEKLNVIDAVDRQVDRAFDPDVLGDVNESQIKVAKFGEVFDRHRHPDEDGGFVVLRGRIAIDCREATVELGEGDFLVMPRAVGVRVRRGALRREGPAAAHHGVPLRLVPEAHRDRLRRRVRVPVPGRGDRGQDRAGLPTPLRRVGPAAGAGLLFPVRVERRATARGGAGGSLAVDRRLRRSIVDRRRGRSGPARVHPTETSPGRSFRRRRKS